MQKRDGDRALVAWDRIGGDPATFVFPSRDAGGPTRATRYLWGVDPRGLQVELIRIDGGGHAEPSLARTYGPLYRHFAGRQNGDFESAEEAWRFFRGKTAGVISPAEPPASEPAPPAAVPIARVPRSVAR